MVGKFFHTIDKDSGMIKWQGKILKKIETGFYLVQLYSWMFGQELSMRIVDIHEMKSWILYDNCDEMKESWEEGEAAAIQHAATTKQQETKK